MTRSAGGGGWKSSSSRDGPERGVTIRLAVTAFVLAAATAAPARAQGAAVGTRIDLTASFGLNGGGGQFAQMFVPDYYRPPADSGVLLVFHFHGASSAAEDQVTRARANAVLFNVHIGALSSPYQAWFADQSRFGRIIDTVLWRLDRHGIVRGARLRTLVVTSFSAGYAGVREVLKVPAYFQSIDALNLADGLHCNSDPPTREVQMRDFLAFARDAAARRRIFCLTHSSITTSGYESTTQTANYLLAGLGTGRTPWTTTDSIGQMYSRADTGRFHLRGYLGETAPDHLKHLAAMHMMIAQVMQILGVPPVGVEERGDVQEGFRLEQNYPNPFNGATLIRFSIREGSGEDERLRLAVYDLLGREVAVLVDGAATPGDYSVPFDGTRLPSGVYLYRLQTADAGVSRRMTLVK